MNDADDLPLEEAKDGNHIAGEADLELGIQRCVMCGGLLSDYRNIRQMAGVGEAPRALWWNPGPVHRSGNMTGVGHTEDLPNCHDSS